ncbi:MAG TPA: glycosyltransferase [Gemmataceae bacterium]|nr:glycosyltransferase [Gemmataceae bacterium]
MHFLLVQQGTEGDVYPYLAVGAELRRRGHEVSFVSHTTFGALIRRHDIEFLDLEDEEHHRMIQAPEYWDPVKGRPHFTRFLTDSFRKQYELVVKYAKPGHTIAVTSVNGMGVRIAHEKMGLPFVSMHICPFMIGSHCYPSDMPAHNLVPYLRGDPTGLGHKIYFWCADRFFIDPLFKPEVNRIRKELGLPPVSRIFYRWMHSPQLIIGLFPRWYVEPYPPDWPPQTRLTQFPLQDNGSGEELPASVARFLAAGEPPVVFSPGTGTTHLSDFYSAAVDACARLRTRGLLLTRFRQQLPEKLPDFMHHEPYLPFSQILPRAAALISHGGVGSIAQGLAAGIPQLIMPMNFDQPDNARRLREFGVARHLSPKRFRGPNVARELDYLLHSPAVRESCLQLQRLFPNGNAVKQPCDLLESFADEIAVQRKAQATVGSRVFP